MTYFLFALKRTSKWIFALRFKSHTRILVKFLTKNGEGDVERSAKIHLELRFKA